MQPLSLFSFADLLGEKVRKHYNLESCEDTGIASAYDIQSALGADSGDTFQGINPNTGRLCLSVYALSESLCRLTLYLIRI